MVGTDGLLRIIFMHRPWENPQGGCLTPYGRAHLLCTDSHRSSEKGVPRPAASP